MIANYHTHTWRCHHADGTEREYVEKAIESGLKILGFSDHTPQVYPNGFVCPYKMEPRELEGYVDTILDLKREYREDIEIHLGLEGFLYFAHPDVMWFAGPDEVYEAEMTALCRYCRKAGIPLEINLLGVREDRNYPREVFWQIAAREGNALVYGTDAHHADHVYSQEVIEKADRFMERCGIPRERLVEVLELG